MNRLGVRDLTFVLWRKKRIIHWVAANKEQRKTQLISLSINCCAALNHLVVTQYVLLSSFFSPCLLSFVSFRIWQDFSCPFFTCCTLHCFRPWGLGCFSRQKTCHVTLKRPPHFDEFFFFSNCLPPRPTKLRFYKRGSLMFPPVEDPVHDWHWTQNF